MREARRRENSKCFQETVLERLRLIACKSCSMKVKLHRHHINELSAAWSEFPQKRTCSFSQNRCCSVWQIHHPPPWQRLSILFMGLPKTTEAPIPGGL